MINETIKKLRLQAGWSQSELAKKACVTSACISSLEKGKKSPSLRTFELLARAFNVSLGELLEFHIDSTKDRIFVRKFNILKKLSESDQYLILTIAQRLSEK